MSSDTWSEIAVRFWELMDKLNDKVGDDIILDFVYDVGDIKRKISGKISDFVAKILYHPNRIFCRFMQTLLDIIDYLEREGYIKSEDDNFRTYDK